MGRREEIREIVGRLVAGKQRIAIVGAGGIGKTTLANGVLNFVKDRFDGGVVYSSGLTVTNAIGPTYYGPNELEKFLSENTKNRRLVVLDDLDVVADTKVHDRLNALLKAPDISALLLSRTKLASYNVDVTYALKNFSRQELETYLSARPYWAADKITDFEKDQIYKFTHGNVLLANLAMRSLEEGTMASWGELLSQATPFRSSGILGPDGKPANQNSTVYRQVVVDVSSTNQRVIEILKTEPELVRELPPRRFEEVVAEILDSQGYTVELTPASRDGGLDIYAAKKEGLGKFLYLVECKRYAEHNKVGVDVIRSLYGTVQAKRASAGALVSTSFFTRGAREFESEFQHQLHLHDYLAFKKWIDAFPSS